MAVAAAELSYTKERLSNQSLAYSAEFHPNHDEEGEVYAHATARMADLGRVMVEEQVEIETTGIYQQVLVEYLRGLAENLTTDEEFDDLLKFDGLDTYRVVNGQVVDKSGQPVVDLVRAGLESSKQAIEENPKMWIQAERDAGDVMVAETVDTLEVGEAYVVASVDPRRALTTDSKFWRNKGYKKGMTSLQVFYKVSDTEVWAGAYSVMNTDLTVLRTMMQSMGADIPTDISDNHWTRHGARFDSSEDEIRGLGKKMQDEHRRRIGQKGRQISVSDLVAAEHDNLLEYFNALILPLSRARHTKLADPAVVDFARRLLPRSDTLSPAEKRTLIHVANSRKFSTEDTRVMEGFIRYAIVEELRKKLEEQINGSSTSSDTVASTSTRGVYNPVEKQLGQLNERLTTNVKQGREAGRSYLGCSPTGQKQGELSTQDKFGGKAEPEGAVEEKEDGCEYQGTFCYCCPFNSDGTKANKLIVVTARRRNDGVAECLRPGCNATIDAKGNAFKGSIYARAMQRQSAKAS